MGDSNWVECPRCGKTVDHFAGHACVGTHDEFARVPRDRVLSYTAESLVELQQQSRLEAYRRVQTVMLSRTSPVFYLDDLDAIIKKEKS